MSFAAIIERSAAEFGVDPALVAAVIRVESNGDPSAVSRHGAMGLMQLMPTTCRDYGVMDPYDPNQNIRGGTALLARDLARYRGNMQKALAAYNAGPRRVDDGSWVHMSEPRNYVPAVLDYYRVLKSSERPRIVEEGAPNYGPETSPARSAGIPPGEATPEGTGAAPGSTSQQ